MNTKRTIILIDDHPLIHSGLETLLANDDHVELIACVFSAKEAFEAIDKQISDLAIVDLSLGESDGIYLIQKLRKMYPKLQILVYTMSEEKLFSERTALAGANGYVMKTTHPLQLKDAIRSVANGNPHFAPEILERIQLKTLGKGRGPISVIDILSNREMDVFKLVGEGLDSSEIGIRLKISRNTVDTHRINIKNKLDMPNGKALDRYAYETIKNGHIPE